MKRKKTRAACISGPGMQTGKSTATACLVPVRQSYPEIVPAVKRAYFELRDVIMSSGKKSMEHLFRKDLSVVGLDPPGKEEEDEQELNSLETDGPI